MLTKTFLFNFAASHSGGGLKRLQAYAEWFNRHGGASFIVHSHCSYLKELFPNNHFFLVNPSRWQRLLNDCAYLEGLQQEIGTPDVYYAYGIPVYSRFGKKNWFHLSNVLPLYLKGIPLSLLDKAKLRYLGQRITRGFEHADIISAESQASFALIDEKYRPKFALSVNGSDDELGYHSLPIVEKENTAVVVGTYRYKALDDAYRVFLMLKEKNPTLTLRIIGEARHVPSLLKQAIDVAVLGALPQTEVIRHLQGARYYISTTYIENSYNAASEGIFFADESFMSDIGPHRELIEGMPRQKVAIPALNRELLHVKKNDLSTVHLKNWDHVIREMVNDVA